ncbi:MAG: 2-oxoacid:ferredoxin oxidoreductase subunit alpha [Conexivisphaerales archaeon]
MLDDRLSWVVGGPQGSGVDSAATIYARSVAEGKLFIHGEREYYSNIKGEHSYYTVISSHRKIRSRLSVIHVLATFEEETIAKHAFEVLPGGAIIYDPMNEATLLKNIPTLEEKVRKDIEAKIGKNDVSIKDVLTFASSSGVRLVPIPYNDLIAETAKKLGADPGRLLRAVNVMSVSASLALLKYPAKHIETAIASVFRGKESVISENIEASRTAYEYASRFRDGIAYTLNDRAEDDPQQMLLLQGTQAVALGKIAAGGRFQSYYPITPASDESFFLEEYETLGMGKDSKDYLVVIQSEDEIAAVTMAIGASLAGVRASTATSGPGFSLMMEGIGWAGINEVPLVITLYQRGGPSTGLPTRSEQADLLFALNSGHGELPRIVLSSGDIEECFYDAGKAFNYAERYQVPVIHLIDKQIANSTATVPMFDLSKVKIDRGKLFVNGNGGYKRFQFTDDGISPRSFLGQEGGVSWYTGDEHDEMGHITEEPWTRRKMMDKRMGKLEIAAKEIPLNDKLHYYGPSSPDLLLVGWGGTKGPVLDLLEVMKDEGYSVAFLQVRLMSPFPSQEVSKILESAKDVIAVESNYSAQLKQLIAQKTGKMIKREIVKYTGRPMALDELHEAVIRMMKDEKLTREVLMSGA